jgi:hypothetical protein
MAAIPSPLLVSSGISLLSMLFKSLCLTFSPLWKRPPCPPNSVQFKIINSAGVSIRRLMNGEQRQSKAAKEVTRKEKDERKATKRRMQSN